MRSDTGMSGITRYGTLPKDLIKQLDITRGDIMRGTYIKRMLEIYSSPLTGIKITFHDGWLEQFLNGLIVGMEAPVLIGMGEK